MVNIEIVKSLWKLFSNQYTSLVEETKLLLGDEYTFKEVKRYGEYGIEIEPIYKPFSIKEFYEDIHGTDVLSSDFHIKEFRFHRIIPTKEGKQEIIITNYTKFFRDKSRIVFLKSETIPISGKVEDKYLFDCDMKLSEIENAVYHVQNILSDQHSTDEVFYVENNNFEIEEFPKILDFEILKDYKYSHRQKVPIYRIKLYVSFYPGQKPSFVDAGNYSSKEEAWDNYKSVVEKLKKEWSVSRETAN